MEVRELGTFAAIQTCLMNLDKVMDNIWLKSSIKGLYILTKCSSLVGEFNSLLNIENSYTIEM